MKTLFGYITEEEVDIIAKNKKKTFYTTNENNKQKQEMLNIRVIPLYSPADIANNFVDKLLKEWDSTLSTVKTE